MNKIKIALSSRTVWTVIVLFVINGFSGIRNYIPSLWLPLIDGILSILAIYFRVHPHEAESVI